MSARALARIGPRWAAVCALALACGSQPEAPHHLAPAQPRAALILEPPRVALGGVAELELAVVTRPGWSVRPQPAPSGLQGFAWIGREPARVAREPARWVHRLPMRLRALDVGRFEVPGGSVEVVSPEGEVRSLAYEPLVLEVLSGLSDAPSRDSPFGVRLLPRRVASPAALLGAFAAGAGFALAALGLLLLARRRLAQPMGSPPSPAGRPPWEWAREELARARELLAGEPRAALDAAARTLRRYVASRFGGDARVLTTPELQVAKPPFALTTRWQALVALLAELDKARFPAPPPAEQAREQAERLLAEVASFVDATTPVESR
jgi:hypothetical protein